MNFMFLKRILIASLIVSSSWFASSSFASEPTKESSRITTNNRYSIKELAFNTYDCGKDLGAMEKNIEVIGKLTRLQNNSTDTMIWQPKTYIRYSVGGVPYSTASPPRLEVLTLNRTKLDSHPQHSQNCKDTPKLPNLNCLTPNQMLLKIRAICANQ